MQSPETDMQSPDAMESIASCDYPIPVMVSSDPAIPRLANGDRLTRPEFERRYDAMPNLKKAELIEGEVYMSSPVSITRHAQPHAHLVGWLAYFAAKTSGLTISDNGSNRLDNDNMPQPDAALLLPKSCGGTGYLDEDDYIAGAPDLVCEVAASNVSLALGKKLTACRRNGVREYLVVRTEDQAVDWFDLVGGEYVPKMADEQGRLRSQIFPGLWLDPAALLAGDLPKLFAVVDEGVNTDEHRAFVEKLAAGTT